MDVKLMKRAADNIRVLAATMVENARSGHPGGAMGGADFVNMLYTQFLVSDPDNPLWPLRDRFFLDPGHMSPMLYSVLALTGKYTIAELQQLRSWGSVTPGHPELDPRRGVENTSGPLGQGHAMAVGCAIAAKFLEARFGKAVAHKVYTFISDGGIQEEIAQGAGRIAGYLGLSNLIMFYDSNGVQLSTNVDAVSTEDYAAKYRAWHWHVIEIDGNDPEAIAAALVEAGNENERPTLIIGHTIMGKGAVTASGDNFEGRCSTHGQPLSKSGADFAATLRNLGADPADPWRIFPEVEKLYADSREAMRVKVAARREAYDLWAKTHQAEAARFEGYMSGEPLQLDWRSVAHKPGCSTRQASSDCLAMLAEYVDNMIVSSADLANSDKTDGFLKKTHALAHGDFTGAFLHAGVAELTMAAIINGIALHGGVYAACGTFFVFSDYMKPAMRMAALMELPVKWVWTHDSFRVGEDGPTHEPVEQEAQLRLLEELRNHGGRPSVLALRPADAAETTVAWMMAMRNDATPTALVLSRQDLPDLPSASGDRYADALQAQRGGYTVVKAENPQIILVGNGSEVSLLCEVAAMLAAEGYRASVVSMPSIGLFNEQAESYREEILPASVSHFGLTAGLPSTLRQIKGFNGHVYGLNHFGASAPYKVLDEKFGFTADNILVEVLKRLE